MTSQDLKAAISVLLASGRASQSELAKRSGVAQAIISRFVNIDLEIQSVFFHLNAYHCGTFVKKIF